MSKHHFGTEIDVKPWEKPKRDWPNWINRGYKRKISLRIRLSMNNRLKHSWRWRRRWMRSNNIFH